MSTPRWGAGEPQPPHAPHPPASSWPPPPPVWPPPPPPPPAPVPPPAAPAPWPPGIGFAPPPAVPPPPHRSGWPVAGAVIGVSLLLVVAAIVVVRGRGTDYPAEWDERVADLAAFVEHERDLAFEHPVTVEFLSEAEYSEAARVDEAMLTDDDRAGIEDSSAVLEALGLVPGDADLFELSNEMNDSGTLAYYDPRTETVIVRGAEVTTAVEVTLVHELTHVVQDQAFDLEPRLDAAAGAGEAYRALIEGDAIRIEQAYVGSLGQAEREAYLDAYAGQAGEAETDLAGVPGAMQALFAAPYALGNPLVVLVAADGGNTAVDDVFTDPPASSEHLLDLRSYFAGDPPVDVEVPDLPDGADEAGEPGVLGAVGLYVMLSARVDAASARDAALGWGGDRYAAYRDGDRTCVRLDVVADSGADLDELAAALRSWAGSGPAGAATISVEGDAVAVDACAPATTDGGSAPGGDPLDALSLVALRSQFAALGASQGGLDRSAAVDFGDCVVDAVPTDVLLRAADATEPTPDQTAAVDAAIGECLGG